MKVVWSVSFLISAHNSFSSNRTGRPERYSVGNEIIFLYSSKFLCRFLTLIKSKEQRTSNLFIVYFAFDINGVSNLKQHFSSVKKQFHCMTRVSKKQTLIRNHFLRSLAEHQKKGTNIYHNLLAVSKNVFRFIFLISFKILSINN